MNRPLRIANCSGFYGDRLAAAREMVDGGPIDVLTGDYLAELTMLILAKAQAKDPAVRGRASSGRGTRGGEGARSSTSCADLWLSGRGPHLGRQLSDDEAIETLTSFLYAGIGGGKP